MLAYVGVQVVALHLKLLQFIVGILSACGIGEHFIKRIGEVLPESFVVKGGPFFLFLGQGQGRIP